MSLLITNIKELLQVRDENVKKNSGKAKRQLPLIKNAYLLIAND